MIDRILEKIYEVRIPNIRISENPERIHAIEASRCIRLSYYERKDPIAADIAGKISLLIRDGIKSSFKNSQSEYRADDLVLEVTAELIIDNEYLIKSEMVPTLPEIPHPRDLLYINACLFAFNKPSGVLVYLTYEGKSVEFSVSRSNRMFEEIFRRARILNKLLKENKVPIVEPSDSCLSCNYYDRCYSRERKSQP